MPVCIYYHRREEYLVIEGCDIAEDLSFGVSCRSESEQMHGNETNSSSSSSSSPSPHEPRISPKIYFNEDIRLVGL